MAITPYRSTDPFASLFESFLVPLGGTGRTGDLLRAPATGDVVVEQLTAFTHFSRIIKLG